MEAARSDLARIRCSVVLMLTEALAANAAQAQNRGRQHPRASGLPSRIVGGSAPCEGPKLTGLRQLRACGSLPVAEAAA